MEWQAHAPRDVYRLVNLLETGYLKKSSDLEPAPNAEPFTVCHRASYGDTDFRYLPHDNVATCAINCINICRSMPKNKEVRNCFTTVAEEVANDFNQTYPTAWFLQEASPEHEGTISRVTNDFL